MAALKIYSWNVNGIRAVHNKGMFVPFVEKHQPDILCLQETKAQQDQSEVDLQNYIEYWNSAEKRGYSGTAIFTRTKPLAVINDFPEELCQKYGVFADKFGDPLKEGRVIAAEYKSFFVVSVYTPNSKGDLGRLELRHRLWDKIFLDYMKQLENKKPVIFMGDLNVAHTEQDLANPKPNVGKHGFTHEEREGFQNFVDAGFIDTFRMFTPEGNGHYTWWTHWANARARNVGWRIDYIMVSTSLKDRVKSAQIHADVMGSDHCPVSIELS